MFVFSVCCLWFAVRFWELAVCWSLCVVRCLLFGASCSLLVGGCWLLAALLFSVRCVLFVWSLLLVVCCLVFLGLSVVNECFCVVCRLLFVGMC